MLGYYWNFMWLDTVALMPLVAAGTISILKDGKFSLYVISLALSIICSFYIGYFVCLFVLLLSVCYTIIKFQSIKQSFKNLGKMIGFTIIAFMLTAFITVPTYMALSHSDSSADAAGFPLTYSINFAYGYKEHNLINTLKALARTVTNLLSFTRPVKMQEDEPNIFCGALSLVLIAFYITAKNIKLKEKIVSLSLLGFFILSFVINQLNYIWHGFNTPAMVYYRFSFLFCFVMVVLAYRAFCLIDTFGKKTFIASSALLVLYLGLAFFVQRKLAVAVTAVAVLALISGFILYRKGKIKYRAASILLCILVVCEMGLSAFYGVRVVGSSDGTNYPKQAQTVAEFAEICENESIGELYRTEFISGHTLNDGALNSLFGITTFNSMCRKDYPDFFTEFGLASSKSNNRYEYVESTPVTNLFLNIKYLIGRAYKSTDDEALIPEEVVDSTYMKLVESKNGNNLYENTAYIPMGFIVDSELANLKLSAKSKLPQNTQNEIFSLATGIKENVLVTVDEKSVSGADLSVMTHHEELGNYYTYKRHATEDEAVTVEYEIPENGSYYGFFRTAEDEEVVFDINGRILTDDIEYTHITSLGVCEKGDRVKVSIPVVKTERGRVGFYLFRFDREVFDQGYEKLSQSSMTLTERTSRSIKGTINAHQDGLFYTSVLYDEGWRAFADGKEVEIIPIANTFCAFELEAGEHEIELFFTPEGLYAGVMVSFVGLVSFAVVAVCVLIKEKRKRQMIVRT